MANSNRTITGKEAESTACRFLETNGLKLVQKNYRSHYGEIDLIMRDSEDIVFVEVRSRRRIDYGHVEESINKHKQRKLIKTATHFLQSHALIDKINSRFDVIAIHIANDKEQLEWFKNAFWP